VEFLRIKRERSQAADNAFKQFSLSNAMRGMEEEPDLYGEGDVRERPK